MPENEGARFSVPGSPGTLAIQVVRLPSGSTALRADAQVVWISPRPASEMIPSGARLLRIAVHAPNPHYREISESESNSLLERLPETVTSVPQIDEIVALLNELEVAQPGLRLCPLARATDNNVELSFYTSAAAAPLAVADILLEGCGGVSLTIGGVPQPSLEGGSELISPIGGILGVTPSVGPPVGPAPRISGVHMSRERFRAEGDGEEEGNVVSTVPSGSEFIFDLSAPAELRIQISRLPHGTRYADTCLAAAERSRERLAGCRRTVLVDRLRRRTAPAGEDAVAFKGRVGGHPLAPGRYVALLRARNTGGRSPVARVEFEITH